MESVLFRQPLLDPGSNVVIEWRLKTKHKVAFASLPNPKESKHGITGLRRQRTAAKARPLDG
jgi:hypothetical protein